MNLKRIILTSRPIMWTWTALMYVVGIGSFLNFSALSIVELFFFTFPINFYLYGLNDIYDTKSDRANDRKDGVQGVVLEDREINSLKKIVWISPALFFLIALFSQNIEHILLAVIMIILVFIYSHPSIRLKEIPILDCFGSASIYCIPGLIAYSLHASIFTLPPHIFLILLPYMGIHAITTLLDDKVDAAAGMTTIGVVFKKTGTILFSLLTYIIAFIAFRYDPFLTSVFLLSIFFHVVFLFIDKKEQNNFLLSLNVVLISFGMLGLVYYILVGTLY